MDEDMNYKTLFEILDFFFLQFFSFLAKKYNKRYRLILIFKKLVK